MNLGQVVGWISVAHPPFYADSVDALRLSTLRLLLRGQGLGATREHPKDKTFFTAEDAQDAEEEHEGFPLRPVRPLR
ncbi:MAG: hypothetical protein WC091_25330 [Sulfuricellaceae bacterium]